VLDAQDHVKGIVSERDVVRAVARADGGGLDAAVSEVMTKEVIYANPRETVDSLLARMTDRRIRHLPVCEGERLVGLVSIGDLVKAKIAETVEEAQSLKAYIAAG
jgi:CBS domain-containing protein